MPRQSSPEYREGELELILSLAPTSENIQRLSKVLARSESALELVYRAAFGHGSFPEGRAFNQKILTAKQALGIAIGLKKPRKKPQKIALAQIKPTIKDLKTTLYLPQAHSL